MQQHPRLNLGKSVVHKYVVRGMKFPIIKIVHRHAFPFTDILCFYNKERKKREDSLGAITHSVIMTS